MSATLNLGVLAEVQQKALLSSHLEFDENLRNLPGTILSPVLAREQYTPMAWHTRARRLSGWQ